MTDIDTRIDSEWHRVSAHVYSASVGQLLKDYVDDVAKAVERKAKQLAPKGPTGRLKSEGVIRTEGRETSIFGDGGVAGSFVDPTSPAFGGGFSIRGGNPSNTGQYSGVDKWNAPGHVFTGGITRSFYEATVELNPLVEHGKWVHEGTGKYGPRKTPDGYGPLIKSHLVFHIGAQKFAVKSVLGQKPNRFITKAFVYVSNNYAPARLSELRLQIAAVT